VPPTDDLDLEAAIALARSGDERGIAHLFAVLHPRLLRYLGSQEPRAAEDLAAQVWLAVAERINAFTGDASDFRAWLFTVARNRLADHRRSGARRRTDPVDAAGLDRASTDGDPEQHAVDQLSGREAARLIATLLPADQAEVLILRTIGDLEVAQVAQILERSPNWVRVTQHRAVRNLARRLGSKIAVIR
jgi:RNA polymerase sigma-70 factor (ECF subfamily)